VAEPLKRRRSAALVMTRFILILVLALTPLTAVAQTAKSNRCVNPEETCMGAGCNKRIPAVFGASYLVPKLKITLIDKNTNKPAAGARMLVHYGFKWLEYPYYPNDEHPFGAWTETAYSTDPCVANEDGVIETDQFKIEPHGYYKGAYSFGHKPKFTQVSITYELPYVGSSNKQCTTSTDITRSQLAKCRRNGRCEFAISDGCPPNWR
jgi:hypothetical protein